MNPYAVLRARAVVHPSDVAVLAPASEHEHHIAVRDSKDPHGPALTFTARQWRDFTAAIKASEFNLT